jgi:hypothetical protein
MIFIHLHSFILGFVRIFHESTKPDLPLRREGFRQHKPEKNNGDPNPYLDDFHPSSFIHSFILGFVGIFSECTFCLLVCLFVCLFVQKRGEGGALHVVVGHGDSWVCFVLFGRQRHHSSRFGQKLTKSVLDVYCTDFDGLVLWAVCGVGEDQ